VNHRHLRYPPETPVEERPVAALVDALERGDFAAWKPIAAAVARDPHGPFAGRIMRIVDAYPVYGASALWRAWIDRRRARAEAASTPATPIGLAGLRKKLGWTQVEIARRMGISQSDLSKLERRWDVRLSTLDAYAEALGGRVRLLFAAGNELAELRLEGTRRPRRRVRSARPRAPVGRTHLPDPERRTRARRLH
jgi:transcriptional regulator with XRE-family HTH domain